MARRFAELLFTPAVRAAQVRYGGRADRLLTAANPRDRLGPDEVEFLQARDGFHLATVGETGWPYVQFRGGRPGSCRFSTSAPSPGLTSAATAST